MPSDALQKAQGRLSDSRAGLARATDDRLALLQHDPAGWSPRVAQYTLLRLRGMEFE